MQLWRAPNVRSLNLTIRNGERHYLAAKPKKPRNHNSRWTTKMKNRKKYRIENDVVREINGDPASTTVSEKYFRIDRTIHFVKYVVQGQSKTYAYVDS